MQFLYVLYITFMCYCNVHYNYNHFMKIHEMTGSTRALIFGILQYFICVFFHAHAIYFLDQNSDYKHFTSIAVCITKMYLVFDILLRLTCDIYTSYYYEHLLMCFANLLMYELIPYSYNEPSYVGHILSFSNCILVFVSFIIHVAPAIKITIELT